MLTSEMLPVSVQTKNINTRKAYLLERLQDEQRRMLRNEFDSALIDTSAQACIDVATELGFTDLADEMASDLHSELTFND